MQFSLFYLQNVCVQCMYGPALNSCAGSDDLQPPKEHLALHKRGAGRNARTRFEKLFMRPNASS